MIYGVTFIDGDVTRHTYKDFGLFQVGASHLSAPEVQKRYIQIPAMDGHIDATQSLDGFVHYNTRSFVGTFKCIARRSEWKGIYSRLLNFLHGKAMRAIFDDEPNNYIQGRFEVGEPDFQKEYFTVPISGEVDPYRYLMFDSLGDWLFDPFSFSDGYAWDYKDIEIDGTTDVIVMASEMPVSPTFTCSSAMTLVVDGTTYNLPSGVSVAPALIIKDREYTFRFTGSGTVTIYFTGGSL